MKRVVSAVTAASLCMALAGCFQATDQKAQPSTQDDTQQSADAGKDSQKDASQGEQEPQIGVVDVKNGALGPVILSDPYASGIHHAWLKIAGYERMEIEIYSDDAPETAALFCKLVRKGYYDNKQLEGLMPNLYATLGDYSGKTDGQNTVDGEFDEAGFKGNTIGLKRGVIAMSREAGDEGSSKDAKDPKAQGTADAGPQDVDSDAAHLYVFLTNASYLDGKYAGFAKITSGISTFDSICASVQSSTQTNKKGKIKKAKDCPVIKYISLED